MAQSATAYVTDGLKSIPLNALDASAWTPADPFDVRGTLSTRTAQTVVPLLFRAIDIRAKAVSRMPLRLEQDGKDVTEGNAPAITRLRALLYLTEAALCLTHQAYWELATNRAGRNITPEWLAVGTIRPDIDPQAQTRDKAVRGYYRTGGNSGTLPAGRVIPFWGPSPTIEIGPDASLAPAAVVLGAAGMLHDLDRYAQGFFQRGGIKMTLLTVEGNASRDERERLKSWWDQMTAGVRSAWRSIVVNAAVKPEVIGSSPNETAAPALTKSGREDIAAGMGVPMALLMLSSPLAGGTADAERLNFYDFTVVPEAEWIVGVANEKYYSRLGQEVILEPKKLEVYQWAEVQKADSISKLLHGQAVLTVDEARALVGYKPMPKEQAPQLQPQEMTGEAPLPPPPDQAAQQQDMVKWQRKARDRFKAGKSLDFPFESVSIPAERADAIKVALAVATDLDAIKAAFEDVEALPPPPRPIRSVLVRGVDTLLGYRAEMRVYGESGGLLATLDSAKGGIDIDPVRGRITPLLDSTTYPDAVRCTLDLLTPDQRAISLLDAPIGEVWQ